MKMKRIVRFRKSFSQKVLFLFSIVAVFLMVLPVNADELSDLKKELKELGDKVEILEMTSGGDDVDEGEERGLDVSGYYDFTFIDDDTDGKYGTFRQHHLSLFFGAKRKKFRFFTEVEFEYGPKIDLDGSTTTSEHTDTNNGTPHTHTVQENDGGTNKAEILVETAWLEYTYANWFSIRTGKHLTPYGWWNQNHYPILVMTTSRPESSLRIFPAISTGIQFSGSVYPGSLQLDYTLYYGNDVNDGGANKWDFDNNKIVGERLLLHLPVFDTFDIGFSALRGHASSSTSNQYWGVDELIRVGSFELLSEFSFNDQKSLNEGGRDLYQKGYYIQPSYAIHTKAGKFAIIYRYDYLNLNSIAFNERDFTVHTFGLLYSPRPDISIKGEINKKHPENTLTGKRDFTEYQASVNMYF